MRQQFFLLTAMALWPLLLPAQTAPVSTTEPSGDSVMITKIVRVRGDVNVLAGLAGPRSGALVQGSNQLHAIVIKGKPDEVVAVERTIHELDALSPGQAATKDVELTVYVLGGTGDAKPDLPDASGDALGPVVKQLRGVFSYSHYYMLTAIVLRSSQDSKITTSGMMKTLQSGPDNAGPANYEVGCRAATVSGDVIHLAGFDFMAYIPYVSGNVTVGGKTETQTRNMRIGSSSDLDLREGQKVVVANSAIGNENAGLFLVVTARLVP